MFSLTRSSGAIGMLAVLTLSTPALAQSDKIAFIADMDAAQVITGSTSTARGTAIMVVDTLTNVAQLEVVMDGLVGVETASHVHGYAAPGAGGPPQFTFATGLAKSATWVYPEVDEASILTDLAYVKVHSSVFPTGEIRGQLVRVTRGVTLMGKMENTAIITGSTSPAKGLCAVTIDTLTNTLTYQETITTSLMLGNETATHIHGYAPPGAGAPPQHTMPLGFHKVGSWVYPEVDEASILAELAYTKTHSDVLPTGEIRGQLEVVAEVDPKDKIVFSADMDAAQVITGSTSTARGTAVMVIDTRSNLAEILVAMDGLVGNETATHIHGYAAPGAGAPPQFTLPVGDYKQAVWVYPEADEASILADLSYCKAHTDVFPTGEIRGQLNRIVADAVFVADMDAAQIITGSPSTARGVFVAKANTLFNSLDYQMTMTGATLMGTESASHIHGYALPGAGGPPQHTMALGNHKVGTWIYPEIDEVNLLGELAYPKVHTTVNPTGEIRGQLRIASISEPNITNYCTAGTSASGCQAFISASGAPSATLSSGFTLSAASFEGNKDGLFFFGANGQQANSWGSGTSFQCVVPPVRRGGLLTGTGTNGACDNFVSQDLNALWCPTCPKPNKAFPAGSVVQAQLWYRDPQNTSNQTTSLSDAVEFTVCP